MSIITTRRRFTATVLSAAIGVTAFGAADASAATVGRILGADVDQPGNTKVVYTGGAGASALEITSVQGIVTFKDDHEKIVPTDATCEAVTAYEVQCNSYDGKVSGLIGEVVYDGGDGDDDVSFYTDRGVVADGGTGDDTLRSNNTAHTLMGGEDDDTLIGNGGGDTLWGDAGNDTISGGDGNDDIRGNAGVDTIDGGTGLDKLKGDAGVDTILAKDGEKDSISCGLSGGTVTADAIDSVAFDCNVPDVGLQQVPPKPQPPAPPAPEDVPADAPADAPVTAPSSAPVPVATPTTTVRVTGPRIALGRARVTRGGRLIVPVTCPKSAAGSCRAVLSGRGVALRRVTVPRGSTRKVTLKLAARQRGLAKRSKTVKLTLLAVARDDAGTGAAVTARIARRAS
ncbi:MAG: hypothetical protein JHC84_03840 [Solirubrobacteraceae bacterium]|nr:hypothetical protein [Solirubrobacteraceae bacterium]